MFIDSIIAPINGLKKWQEKHQGKHLKKNGQTDTILESSHENMSAHKKFQLKAQN